MNEISNIDGIIVLVLTAITFALGFWYGYDAGMHSMRARYYRDQYSKTHASGGA